MDVTNKGKYSPQYFLVFTCCIVRALVGIHSSYLSSPMALFHDKGLIKSIDCICHF